MRAFFVQAVVCVDAQQEPLGCGGTNLQYQEPEAFPVVREIGAQFLERKRNRGNILFTAKAALKGGSGTESEGEGKGTYICHNLHSESLSHSFFCLYVLSGLEELKSNENIWSVTWKPSAKYPPDFGDAQAVFPIFVSN
jgi:hypothetical protein